MITHLIRHLDDTGKNVRSALIKHGIEDFSVSAGYSYTLDDSTIDLASLLEMPDNGRFKIKDDYLEAVFAAGYIARCVQKNDFEVFSHFISFKPGVWKLIIALVNQQGVDGEKLAEAIRYSTINTFICNMSCVWRKAKPRGVGCPIL